MPRFLSAEPVSTTIGTCGACSRRAERDRSPWLSGSDRSSKTASTPPCARRFTPSPSRLQVSRRLSALPSGARGESPSRAEGPAREAASLLLGGQSNRPLRHTAGVRAPGGRTFSLNSWGDRITEHPHPPPVSLTGSPAGAIL